MWRTPVPEGLFPTKIWPGRLRNNSVIENNVCIASKRMKDKSEISEFSNRLRKATPTYDEDDLYDFDWLEKPVVLRMSQAIVDTCYEMLKRKRKPRSVIELYMQFFMKGYLVFTEQDLLEALVKDGRFDVESSDSAFLADVCAARKDRM